LRENDLSTLIYETNYSKYLNAIKAAVSI